MNMKTNFLVKPRFDRNYKKLKKKYPSLPADVELFKKDFADNHNAGTSLGGGFRKVRLAVRSKGKGKSGGARIITCELCLKAEGDTIVLVDIYDKAELDSLKESEYIRLLQDFISGSP